jgi:predicted AlkP superfamily phosphohydrolase/phosphomutase
LPAAWVAGTLIARQTGSTTAEDEVKPPPKVLMLALDAAEPDLLLRWAGDGKLPAIGRLLSRAAFAKTDNPPGLSGATWPTLITGVTAARHGRYGYCQLRPGSYRMRLMTPGELRFPPFWSRLSDAGKRVAIVDVPKTHPIEGLNGLQICDWANHDGDIIDGLRTWPRGLARDLDRRYGRDPLDSGGSFGIRGPRDFSGFARGLCANVERKARLVLDVMDREPWDLVFAAWDDVHWAGHFGWRLHDSAHPYHDPGLADKVGDPLERVLTAVDKWFGVILERVGPDTTVLLLSSHGMGPGYCTRELVEPILRRLEAAPETGASIYGGLRGIWDMLPPGVQRSLAQAKDHFRENLLASKRARRRYFGLTTSHDGGSVRINLVGREPQGRVQPGADYDACCRQLIDEFKAIVDADTGEPVVREVYRPREHMQGELQDLLPDLTIEWGAKSMIRRIRSPGIGEIEVPRGPWRSGEHLPQGLVACSGPGVPTGPIPSRMHAQDLAPTVGCLLGVPIPDVDGVAIEAMAGQGSLEAR